MPTNWLKGQTAWTFLARDANGNLEIREYMAFGVVNDKQIGLQSDIVSVTFGG